MILKRIVDVVGASVGIILTSPIMLISALLVKLTSPGPVIFKQERIGYKGKPFTLYKFRSMVDKAEENGTPELYSGKNDTRQTRVGLFLREHHLDELPQLWNVFKGDMSLVGYRPERKFFVDKIMAINPDYELLYKMRPGVFSKATLYNGYTYTMEKMLKRLDMDLEYLYDHSLWLYLKIIFLTVLSILTGKKF
jgi:lipopolysaccharide/colanic/teichoic acid biosynthesis glycosyltransferase